MFLRPIALCLAIVTASCGAGAPRATSTAPRHRLVLTTERLYVQCAARRVVRTGWSRGRWPANRLETEYARWWHQQDAVVDLCVQRLVEHVNPHAPIVFETHFDELGRFTGFTDHNDAAEREFAACFTEAVRDKDAPVTLATYDGLDVVHALAIDRFEPELRVTMIRDGATWRVDTTEPRCGAAQEIERIHSAENAVANWLGPCLALQPEGRFLMNATVGIREVPSVELFVLPPPATPTAGIRTCLRSAAEMLRTLPYHTLHILAFDAVSPPPNRQRSPGP